jgi:hypothetical protein
LCERRRVLQIRQRIELPPDGRSDEIALQIVRCDRCGFGGIAVYQESRRGALDDESFDHTGYQVSAQDLSQIHRAISRCPKPRDPRCKCASHRSLGSRDASGRWNGLAGIALGDAFALKL